MGFFGELKQDLSQVAGDELKRERADAEAERILAGAQLAGLDEAESFRRSVSTDNNSIDDDDDVAALLKDLVAGLSADDMPLAEEKSSAEETYPNHAPQTEADTAQAETEPTDDEPVVSEEPSESEPKARSKSFSAASFGKLQPKNEADVCWIRRKPAFCEIRCFQRSVRFP